MARQEKYHVQNPLVRFLVDRFFDRLRAVVTPLQPRTLLDAGCGEGELLRRDILPPGVRPVCVDLLPESLADVAAPARVCASVRALPFAPRSFDVVTCLEVLEHLDDPISALGELARVSRHAFVVSVPHEPYFRLGNRLRGKYPATRGNHPEHVQHWNPQSFEAFLRASTPEVRIVNAFPWIIACCRPKQH